MDSLLVHPLKEHGAWKMCQGTEQRAGCMRARCVAEKGSKEVGNTAEIHTRIRGVRQDKAGRSSL